MKEAQTTRSIIARETGRIGTETNQTDLPTKKHQPQLGGRPRPLPPPAQILGVIYWNETTWMPPVNSAGNPDPASVDAQLAITAGIHHSDPTNPESFGSWEIVSTGHVTSVRSRSVLFGSPGSYRPITTFAAHYQIFVTVTLPPETFGINVQPGAAFQAVPAKQSNKADAIAITSDQVQLIPGGTAESDWAIQIVPNFPLS